MLKLPYIAGFFDGEGSIGIYHHGNGKYYLRTQLTQNITPESAFLLKALQDRWGGGLTKRKSNEAFNWQVNGVQAAKMLKALLPHLRLKQKQAAIAIAWQKLQPPIQRDFRGRIVATPATAFDIKVAKLVKHLKKDSNCMSKYLDVLSKLSLHV